jgi:hypothetical protein
MPGPVPGIHGVLSHRRSLLKPGFFLHPVRASGSSASLFGADRGKPEGRPYLNRSG